MENHGRYLEDIDVSRTTGWFTAMFPVIFLLKNNEIGEQIKHVKEKIRKIPNNSIGYGVLNYINNPLKKRNRLSDVRFNYLGQFDKELNNDLFSFISEDTEIDTDERNRITSKIEINAIVIDEKLKIEINYNHLAFKNDTIEMLKDNFKSNLYKILGHIKNEDDIYYTPSDFDAVELDEEDLAILFDN